LKNDPNQPTYVILMVFDLTVSTILPKISKNQF